MPNRAAPPSPSRRSSRRAPLICRNGTPSPVNPPGTASSRVKSRMGFCKDFLQLRSDGQSLGTGNEPGRCRKQERRPISMNLRFPKLFAGGGHRLLVMATVIAGLLAWLWPIGVGGKMPVGGDVTSFFLGLMGVLSESLKAGRLPVWNDLWGYGFPGIGESQMGVYYPPHLVLYRAVAHRVGLRGEPGAAHALGRRGGVVGCAPVRRLARGLGTGGLRVRGFGLLRDPHASSLGLHHRIVDALGLGTGLAGALVPRSAPGRTGSCS